MWRGSILLAAVLAAAAETPDVWLDIPFVRQEKNGCGAASLSMVMRYWKQQGVASIPNPDPAEIQRALYAPKARGIYGRDMERYLENAGFRVFVFSGRWEDLAEHVAKRRPLIVCLRESSRGPLHYVVVAGVSTSDDTVLVNDAARRKLLKLNRKEFETDWSA